MKKYFSILLITCMAFGFSSEAFADSFTTAFFDQYVDNYLSDKSQAVKDAVNGALEKEFGIGFDVPSVSTDGDGNLVVLEALILAAPTNTAFNDFIAFINAQDDDLSAVFNEDPDGIFNSYWEVFSKSGSGTKIPIDGGLGILATLGIFYGMRRVKN